MKTATMTPPERRDPLGLEPSVLVPGVDPGELYALDPELFPDGRPEENPWRMVAGVDRVGWIESW